MLRVVNTPLNEKLNSTQRAQTSAKAHCTMHLLVNALTGTGNCSATSNNMKLVRWPLMGGLLH